MNESRIGELLVFLYGEEAGKLMLPELMKILEAFRHSGGKRNSAGSGDPISHRDAFLISYGDMLAEGKKAPEVSGFARLNRFLAKWNRGSFSYLHLLPFHPYSSDDGFSVIDYRAVDSRFGSWADIEKLGRRFKLVFDFVLNHGSVKSSWFRKFLAGEGEYKNWYITRPADYDYSAVTRPRTHPLLTPFQRDDGSTAHVWTTFSADQADYDFSRPEVLLEFIRIFLEYARRGGKMLRLDAIAYLWKEDGTSCIHHPKTHGVVKLFRALIEYLNLDMLLLTETNVPHRENISYFGETGSPECAGGDEAHLVYNFALPPLILYAALSGDPEPLKKWAAGLPALPPGQYYLNFLASHDGVGLTPARGLVEEAAFTAAIAEARNRGALVSMKSSPQGPVPYELNCSWADMTAPESLGSPEKQARAFLNTYGIALALPGLPAVYFHSWIGSRAWKEGPSLLGFNRAINREKPAINRVEREMGDKSSFRYQVNRGFQRLLKFRRREPAFSPGSPCRILDSPDGVFALIRGPDKRGRSIVCVHNFSAQNKRIDLSQIDSKGSGKSHLPSFDEIPVEANSFFWLAFGGNRKIRKLAR
ncbi:MAG: sugar phosphorylase [Treponema sp.]|jgi:sucrose phosphorylase|nr:sugar phosphorylase [Treponema sp.]